MSLYVLGGVTGGLGKELVSEVPGTIPVGRQDCDVADGQSVLNWTQSLASINALHIINLTGVSVSSMLHKGAPMDWVHILNVNLLGNAMLLKFLREKFKFRPGSTFTMVGSVTTKLGPAGTGVYTASKAALEGLCKVAAKEFAPFGRVNLLELGYFEAGLIKQIPNSSLDVLEMMIPLQRLGTVDDLWKAWQFLIECQYVTGATIAVNGGLV